MAIQRAARSVAPAELFAAAVLDGVAPLHADGDALLAAVTKGEHAAIAAAMRGLARLDGEGVVGAALVFVHEGRGELRRAAPYALARSQSAEALEVLLSALEPSSMVPRSALERSLHPVATERVRAVLLDTGVAMFAVRPRPDLAHWRRLSHEEQQTLLAMQPPGAPTRELQRAQNAISVLGARGDQQSLELRPASPSRTARSWAGCRSTSPRTFCTNRTSAVARRMRSSCRPARRVLRSIRR